jgi:preprotein translocase subunit SecG
MFTLLIVLELVIAILLILSVLMQSSKGGGLAGAFGGGNVGAVFGVRRTADFLTRATQILAGAFLVLALVINIWFLPRTTSNAGSVLLGKGQQKTMTPQLPPPQQQQAPVQ